MSKGNPPQALSGLRVVDLTQTQPGAQASQTLADFGADVVHVEPPGGTPLRHTPAHRLWCRGKKSIALDLHDAADVAVARELAAGADVLIESFRPGVAERLGLGYDDLAAGNPRLVYASVTGFPATGPYASVQGYEALVMAKVGALVQFGPMTEREGPAYVATPFCSFSASQTALHGILAALHERERSGRGQRVRTSLVHGLAALGPYNWFLRIISQRYPDAYQAISPYDDDGVPTYGLTFRLIIGLTADGRWLQFSQTQPRLFDAFLRTLDLTWMNDDPRWKTVPEFDTADQRDEFWTMMLERIKSRTFEEWQRIFDAEPDVWAEVFRQGLELLDHPQLIHDRQVVVLEDPEVGPVRQPGPLVRMNGTPAVLRRSAPRLDEHGAELRAGAVDAARIADGKAGIGQTAAPLAGLTLLELGTFYAAPYGGCVLADLGARVIKIEPLTGEPLRHLLAFPEAGGAKVMQGKESVAVDITTAEGQAVVHAIARQADIVLQTFRGGVAERLNVDEATLRGLNPDLIYLNAPGYGMDGPCGHRPAFAPTIGAGSGIGRRNAGPSVPERADLSIDEIKTNARRLAASVTVEPAQPDGLAALGVATAMLLGLVARDRGHGGQGMLTTMMNTAAHALGDDMVDFSGRREVAGPDEELHGLSALYRLYRASDGWVFLAAPADHEWPSLVASLSDRGETLAGDPRFADSASRLANDAALVEQLTTVFAGDTAAAWESRLLAADVGCVSVAPGPVEAELQSDEFGRASGLLVDVVHPTFGEHPRLAPLVDFSRTPGVAGPAPSVGQHTDSVLREFGYTDDSIAALRSRGVAGGD